MVWWGLESDSSQLNKVDLGDLKKKSLSQVFGHIKLQKKDLEIYIFLNLKLSQN